MVIGGRIFLDSLPQLLMFIGLTIITSLGWYASILVQLNYCINVSGADLVETDRRLRVMKDLYINMKICVSFYYGELESGGFLLSFEGQKLMDTVCRNSTRKPSYILPHHRVLLSDLIYLLLFIFLILNVFIWVVFVPVYSYYVMFSFISVRASSGVLHVNPDVDILRPSVTSSSVTVAYMS